MEKAYSAVLRSPRMGTGGTQSSTMISRSDFTDDRKGKVGVGGTRCLVALVTTPVVEGDEVASVFGVGERLLLESLDLREQRRVQSRFDTFEPVTLRD